MLRNRICTKHLWNKNHYESLKEELNKSKVMFEGIPQGTIGETLGGTSTENSTEFLR